MKAIERAVVRVNRENRTAFLIAEVVCVACLLVGIVDWASISSAVRNAALAVGTIVACATSLWLFYNVWKYTKDDPEIIQERTPPWRLTLLIAVLAIAISSIWWAPKIFP